MASGAMCRGFNSLQARVTSCRENGALFQARSFYGIVAWGPLAQLVEQLTLNQRVVGSIPTRLTILYRYCL